MTGVVHVDRRTVLTASAFGAAAPMAGPLVFGAMFVRTRDPQVGGPQTGDVTPTSAVLWAQSEGAGRMHVELSTNGIVVRRARGGHAHVDNDFTGRIHLTGLAPGRDYEARLWFDNNGVAGEPREVTFSTPGLHPSPLNLVWSADTCGQGWGINPDFGGLIGYKAMADVEPDVFVHCGDMIYADMPIKATKLDGTYVWRNETNEHVSKVAESLTEFRAHYRYNLSDEHLTAFNAKVPMIGQWDDHEVVDNWWSSKILDDDRYREKRFSVLARVAAPRQPVLRSAADRSGGPDDGEAARHRRAGAVGAGSRARI
ncbi:MAG: alkaline phosphatase, partial [Myxococcales bacterium]